jgi:hypothetical protein
MMPLKRTKASSLSLSTLSLSDTAPASTTTSWTSLAVIDELDQAPPSPSTSTSTLSRVWGSAQTRKAYTDLSVFSDAQPIKRRRVVDSSEDGGWALFFNVPEEGW